MPALPLDFYLRPDVVQIARDLLGKLLVTKIGGNFTSGLICETEAYAGITDRASHACGGRRTGRTETMYARGGTAYVYLCYGIHSLFNVVTNVEDVPHAVLVRGIIPVDGIEIMLKRAAKEKADRMFGIGPGKVSRILGIHYSHSGIDLTTLSEENELPGIWIEDRGMVCRDDEITTGTRIGVGYAGVDALLPYRFQLTKPLML